MCLVCAYAEDFMLDLDEHRRTGLFDPLQRQFCLLKGLIGFSELPLVLIGIGLSKFKVALVFQTIEKANNLLCCLFTSCIFFNALIFFFLKICQKPFEHFMFSVFVAFFIELYQTLHNLTEQLEILNINQNKSSLLLTFPECFLCLLEVNQLFILGDLDFIVLVLFGYLLFVLFLV